MSISILLVENEQTAADMFKEISEKVRGVKMFTAKSIVEAIEILKSKQPIDVVMLDLKVHAGSEVATTRKIVDVVNHRIPVVAYFSSQPEPVKTGSSNNIYTSAMDDHELRGACSTALIVATASARNRTKSEQKAKRMEHALTKFSESLASRIRAAESL